MLEVKLGVKLSWVERMKNEEYLAELEKTDSYVRMFNIRRVERMKNEEVLDRTGENRFLCKNYP